MKKELVAFSMIVCGLCSAPVFAANSCGYSCVAPYNLAEGSAVLSKISGTNFLASKLAAQFLKSQIKKNANGVFKVSVKSYSVTDLKEGRFKYLEIQGKNVVTKDVHFSSVNAKTLCDFNYVVYNKNKSTVVFKEDFPMSFSVVFSEEDLNNTMSASGYAKLIRQMNEFGTKYALFEILSTKVGINDNKFIYTFNLKIPIFNSQFTVALKSDLIIDNGQIVMKNPELVNNYSRIDMSKLTRAFNNLNPLVYSLNVFKNKSAKLSVKNISIVNDKINVSGIIYMPKDVLTQHKD